MYITSLRGRECDIFAHQGARGGSAQKPVPRGSPTGDASKPIRRQKWFFGKYEAAIVPDSDLGNRATVHDKSTGNSGSLVRGRPQLRQHALVSFIVIAFGDRDHRGVLDGRQVFARQLDGEERGGELMGAPQEVGR
jgi:hypothetical protein